MWVYIYDFIFVKLVLQNPYLYAIIQYMEISVIGFIGQGFIGKNYADDFEKRGFKVIRYSLEDDYICNKELISGCDVVFIAVPTPTKPSGFDSSLLEDSLKLVGNNKIAVIKSTVLPGTTRRLQKDYPNIWIVHSPEFLREVSAAYDAANPERNIIGIPLESSIHKELSEKIIRILPQAKFSNICSYEEAELIKYAGNNFLNMKVVYINIIYEIANEFNCDWTVIRDSMLADARIGSSHMNPIHDGGRGAGGHCFIKDFAAFRDLYEKVLSDQNVSIDVLKSIENKNISLLKESGKNNDLLNGVYGDVFYN